MDEGEVEEVNRTEACCSGDREGEGSAAAVRGNLWNNV